MSNMVFHDNKLVEISLFDESEAKHIQSRTQPTSRTSTGEPVKQEETPEKKRKRKEATNNQTLYNQPAVNSARAADMDHIHFSEPFEGFNYTLESAYDHSAPSYNYTTLRPWMQAPSNEGTFYNDNILHSSDLAQSLSGDTLVPGSFVPGSFAAAEPTYPSDPGLLASASFAAVFGNTYEANGNHSEFRQENAQDDYTVSATPAEESDFAASESDEERPRKDRKLNKDGAPRKPRQPRPKLLKWTDDDWKNVCLGIVWACGETGVQIPFEQAAQVVGEKCTAGALQQALLKLRGKQVAEGYQIPSLRMAWTRKNRYATPSAKAKASQEPEANRPRKKPTRVEATQSLIVTVPRPYNDHDRQGMVHPYTWKKPSRKTESSTLQTPADMKQEDSAGAFPYTQAEGIHDHGFNPQTPTTSQGTEYLLAMPMTGRQFYNSPPVAVFGQHTGYLQDMNFGGEGFTSLLTTEGLHDIGNGLGDASDDVFSI